MHDRGKVDDKLAYKEKFVKFRSALRQYLGRFSQVARLDSLKFKPIKAVCLEIDFGSLSSEEAFLDTHLEKKKKKTLKLLLKNVVYRLKIAFCILK